MIPPGLDASLVLLRHGETAAIAEGRFQGGSDNPLSPLGERQAGLAAERIADPSRPPLLPIPAGPPLEIVHSPLSRATVGARLAAAALAMRHGAPPPLRPEPGFRELGQGVWEGMRRDEIAARYPDELAGWRARPAEVNAPGGERVADLAARGRAGLEAVFAGLAGAPPPTGGSHGTAGYPPPPAPDTPWTLIVGHDGLFKTLMCTLFGMPLERFWAWPFGLCGISVVEIRGGMPVLRAHNLTEHLTPLTAVGGVPSLSDPGGAGAGGARP
ncbi:MAG: hypothetical protein RL338_684 [Chloroflexota bacterium]